MPRKKKVIPEYGTCIRKGIEYYRTRIVDSDGKRVSLYARTPEELYEKVQEAERLIAEASFRKENPTVNEYCEKWLLFKKVVSEPPHTRTMSGRLKSISRNRSETNI